LNIENALGTGAALVLGKDIAEDVWTKVLPKSGPKFQEAITHLKNAGLMPLASTYNNLMRRIIEHELHFLAYNIARTEQEERRTWDLQQY